MIRALSPYYVRTNLDVGGGVACEYFTLTVQVWDGDKASPDSTNEYKLTYNNTAAATGNHDINISAMIQDYVEFTAPSPLGYVNITSLLNANNQAWVYTYVTYNGSTTKHDESTELMTLGYTYGDEGENYTNVTDNFLMPVMDYKINKYGIFIIPLLSDEVTDNDVTISADGGAGLTSFTVLATTDSSKAVRNLWIDVQNDFSTASQYLSVTYKGNTINLDLYDEARYTPMDVLFQNKDGALQAFTFFKDRKEETTVTDSVYQTRGGQGSDGFHQFVRYNVQARNSVSASTGFIRERENEVIQQLMYARRAWIHDTVSQSYKAVSVKDTSKQFKTQLTDRLINYTMKFEYAYNQINNT
tara:strand:- start:433 stop:1506 length:1074 start_codon:yes stop_codon:yes gene_type:complete